MSAGSVRGSHFRSHCSRKIVPTPDQAKPGLDFFAKSQTEFDVTARGKLFQQMAQWYWVDFVVRADLFDDSAS